MNRVYKNCAHYSLEPVIAICPFLTTDVLWLKRVVTLLTIQINNILNNWSNIEKNIKWLYLLPGQYILTHLKTFHWKNWRKTTQKKENNIFCHISKLLIEKIGRKELETKMWFQQQFFYGTDIYYNIEMEKNKTPKIWIFFLTFTEVVIPDW